MKLLAAVEQFQERYVFLMPQGYQTNYVTIAAPVDAMLTLDGSPTAAALTPMAWEAAESPRLRSRHPCRRLRGEMPGSFGEANAGDDDVLRPREARWWQR